jgi:hypothetical protein
VRGWVGNAIDAFLASQHEQRGVQPVAAAENRVLLRRVYLDLIGLPPSPDELQAFLADTRPDAYERVVDWLLARPQYGERWGRHWMDVWRYSDWYGRRAVPDVLNSYAQIWRWRDWIVRALNEDHGYDRMIMEMLAADEIAPQDDEAIVATGFLVRNFYRWNYSSWISDNVEHTAKAFLALTLNCCHCHDHKYDPITQEEYFKFRAFFEPLELRHDRVPGEPDPGPFPKYDYGVSYPPIASGLVRVMDEKLDAETYVYTAGESRNLVPGAPPVPPGVPAAVGGDDLRIERIELPLTAWYPGLKPFVQHEETARVKAAVEVAEKEVAAAGIQAGEAKGETFLGPQDSAPSDAQPFAELAVKATLARLNAARLELASVEARIEADRARYVSGDAEAGTLARTAYQAERHSASAASAAKLATAQLELARAEAKPADDPKRPMEIDAAQKQLVAAKSEIEACDKASATDSTDYTPLGPQYPRHSTGRRAALGRWIASPRNPLTARVAINYLWLKHFGRALVETTDNFGRSGARPTHPELLDWLAVELMHNGWHMKPIHRMIVTSSAYRLGSQVNGGPEHRIAQGEKNSYLWRRHPARVEAEIVRDSILYVSGELDLAMGGREIEQRLGSTSRRRSLYFAHHGEERMPFLDLFDAANPGDCYRRRTSVRPQQALALSNGELALWQGRLLARKLDAIQSQKRAETTEPVGDERAKADNAFIATAFEHVLGREPSSAELAASSAFLNQQAQLFLSAGPAHLTAQTQNEAVPPSADPAMRARESLVQALFSHHDFVTIH